MLTENHKKKTLNNDSVENVVVRQRDKRGVSKRCSLTLSAAPRNNRSEEEEEDDQQITRTEERIGNAKHTPH